MKVMSKKGNAVAAFKGFLEFFTEYLQNTE